MKIISVTRFLFLLGLLYTGLFFSCTSVRSQVQQNPYGLKVTRSVSEYSEQVKKDSLKMLVDLQEAVPGLILDIRYATTNNFTGVKIYDTPRAFARKEVAVALANVQKELNQQGLGLKIFDAYRPYSATVKFYEVYPDTTFVAAPWKGSVHNRGCSVDLTLVHLNTGAELEMPTGFDDFTERAAHSYHDLTDEVLKNRKILKDAMTRNGFQVYDAEWWHYNYQNWKDYEIMDLSFRDLGNSLSK